MHDARARGQCTAFVAGPRSDGLAAGLILGAGVHQRHLAHDRAPGRKVSQNGRAVLSECLPALGNFGNARLGLASLLATRPVVGRRQEVM